MTSPNLLLDPEGPMRFSRNVEGVKGGRSPIIVFPASPEPDKRLRA